MHELFAQRIEQGLGKLGERIKPARKKLERGKLERQIGRLLDATRAPQDATSSNSAKIPRSAQACACSGR